MSAQKANNVQRWCNCVGQCVEHKHMGLQDFGWAVMDTYQCAQCHTLKLFLVHEGHSLANRAEAIQECEPLLAPVASALRPGLSSA